MVICPWSAGNIVLLNSVFAKQSTQFTVQYSSSPNTAAFMSHSKKGDKTSDQANPWRRSFHQCNPTLNTHTHTLRLTAQLNEHSFRKWFTDASLLGTRTLLGAPGLTTRSKDITRTRSFSKFAFQTTLQHEALQSSAVSAMACANTAETVFFANLRGSRTLLFHNVVTMIPRLWEINQAMSYAMEHW